MKRYRDERGKLTKSIDEIAAQTREEATAYYIDGARYLYGGREYVLHLRDDQTADGNKTPVAHFESADGYNLYTAPEKLGTFLPDIASDGLEITRI